MTIAIINNKKFDTTKALRHWSLNYFDGNNHHYGDLYLSSKGSFYCWTPSQWSNRHSWDTNSVDVLIDLYGQGLSDKEKAEILELAKIETE